jgi:hypothetical protein
LHQYPPNLFNFGLLFSPQSDSAPAAEEAPKLWSKAAEAIARDRFEHDSNYSYEDWNQKDDIYNRSREDMMTSESIVT